jgi:hypothetical protein
VHTKGEVPNTDQPVRIPLREREALKGLLAVKPTASMPRPSTHKPVKRVPKPKSAN